MKKFRFISEEDLMVVAIYLDQISTTFPVDKVPELAKTKIAAVEALNRTVDAQNRGLFLSVLQEQNKQLAKLAESLMMLEGRTALAQQVVGPAGPVRGLQPDNNRIERPFEGKSSVPGEESVVLNFDDFGGGAEG